MLRDPRILRQLNTGSKIGYHCINWRFDRVGFSYDFNNSEIPSISLPSEDVASKRFAAGNLAEKSNNRAIPPGDPWRLECIFKINQLTRDTDFEIVCIYGSHSMTEYIAILYDHDDTLGAGGGLVLTMLSQSIVFMAHQIYPPGDPRILDWNHIIADYNKNHVFTIYNYKSLLLRASYSDNPHPGTQEDAVLHAAVGGFDGESDRDADVTVRLFNFCNSSCTPWQRENYRILEDFQSYGVNDPIYDSPKWTRIGDENSGNFYAKIGNISGNKYLSLRDTSAAKYIATYLTFDESLTGDIINLSFVLNIDTNDDADQLFIGLYGESMDIPANPFTDCSVLFYYWGTSRIYMYDGTFAHLYNVDISNIHKYNIELNITTKKYQLSMDGSEIDPGDAHDDWVDAGTSEIANFLIATGIDGTGNDSLRAWLDDIVVDF